MASETLGLNKVFPIYIDSNGTRIPFHDLVLKKSSWQSVVMALGDKISGDVYYKDASLEFSMQEYVIYNDVKYTLVNPPTLVKEGLVKDNSDLRGMAKYSLEFYHPMYELSNLPFSDVAVTQSQKMYLSESHTFAWAGYLADYIAKINKNLEGTQWIVDTDISSIEEDVRKKYSGVLTFDKNFIADALKVGYDTFGAVYTIRKISTEESAYSDGKRFAITFGNPTREIYQIGNNGVVAVDNDNNPKPFVFKYGQGCGIKNNSKTSKNNKIVTRIVGQGSDDNIPYGYPQILWYGESGLSFTYGDNVGTYTNVTIGGHTFAKIVSYPIYKGILGGQYVELIKHPFTRTFLMPSVYRDTLFNKISFLNEDGTPNTNYDPDITLVDYYDAGDTYENPINANAPSVEFHQFDIKPELGDVELQDAVKAYDEDIKEYMSWDALLRLLDKYIAQAERAGHTKEVTAIRALKSDIQTSLIQKDVDWQVQGEYSYKYSFKKDTNKGTITLSFNSKLKIENVQDTGILTEIQAKAYLEGVTPQQIEWDDTMDENGEYKQSYFRMTLPILDFDLYACAAITQQMSINMRSGDCIGCTFEVKVDWDDYKKNFYDDNGNFSPNGEQRDLEKYPKSNVGKITVIVQKDNSTFGTLIPNKYQMPKEGDTFVILGISLPLPYITNAQERLDNEMKSFMRQNNIYRFDFPLKFDEYFLKEKYNILEQISPDKLLRFVDNMGDEKSLYIQQISIKFGDSVLPQYDITLTEQIEVVLNSIGKVASDVEKISTTLSNTQRNIQKISVIEGEKGDMGRNYYYWGEWEDFISVLDNTFEVTDAEAPYFKRSIIQDNVQVEEYWVFVGDNGVYDITTEPPSENSVLWERMESKFKFIISQAIFSAFARLGNWIFNGDYMYSDEGWKIESGEKVNTSFSLGARFYGEGDENNTYTPNTFLNAKTGLVFTNKANITEGAVVGGFNIGSNYIGNASGSGTLFRGLRLYNDGRIIVGYNGADDNAISFQAFGEILLDGGNGKNITISNTAGSEQVHGNITIYGYLVFWAANGYLDIKDLGNESPQQGNTTRVWKDSKGYLRIGYGVDSNVEETSSSGTSRHTLTQSSHKVFITQNISEIVLPQNPFDGQEIVLANISPHSVSVRVGNNSHSIVGNGGSFSTQNLQTYIYHNNKWYYGYMPSN